MEAEQNKRRRGMSDDEARRRSHATLGGVERTREEVRDARGTRLLEDTAGDVAFTWRTLTRSPAFALVAVLTLAIGIGGTTAVYSAVDAVLLQPLPYQQSGRLVRLYQYFNGFPDQRNFVTAVHFLDYRTKVAAFESAAAIVTYNESGADIGSADDVRRIRLLRVSADYFDVVRVQPALGSALSSRGRDRGALGGAEQCPLEAAIARRPFGSRQDTGHERRHPYDRGRDAGGLHGSAGRAQGPMRSCRIDLRHRGKECRGMRTITGSR